MNERPRGSASVLIRSGAKSSVSIATKKELPTQEAMIFKVEPALDREGKTVDLRLSWEEKGRVDSFLWKVLTIEAGTTAEIALKGQRVLRIRAEVEE